MKAIEDINGTEGPLTTLVGAAAGAITATLAAKLAGRPRPAKRRRARTPSGASRGRRAASEKGGGRHG